MASDPVPICEWKELAGEKWHALLLGNGASIALDSKFAYKSLHAVASASGRLPSAAPIFGQLGTSDFEHVLLACWYAELVNAALGAQSAQISTAYSEVRAALISTIQAIHPDHTAVAPKLGQLAAFASTFETVVTLNYDVTLYWAMLKFNEAHGQWFKDAFHGGVLASDWEYMRQPYRQAKGTTMVFYPHGSLCIARNRLGAEVKISNAAPGGGLLDAIYRKWDTGDWVPVFVSEGTTAEKMNAIRRSHYLSTVLDSVLPKLGDSVVVYGWSFDDRDQHILEAIEKGNPSRIAVSVFRGLTNAERQSYCHRVLALINARRFSSSVRFFDSDSSGAWVHP